MKRVIVSTVAASLLVSSAAFGAISDDEIEQLRGQLALLSQRLEDLAAENAELKRSQDVPADAIAEVQAAVTAAVPASGNWSDRISLEGDFRYRYERIDPEGSDTRRRNPDGRPRVLLDTDQR